MTRPALGHYLDLALGGQFGDAALLVAAELDDPATPGPRASRVAALAAFTAVIQARHDSARALSDRAMSTASDEGSTAMACALATFVGCLAPPGERPPMPPSTHAWELLPLLRRLDEADGVVASYLAIEGCMSAGRLGDAELIATEYLSKPWQTSTQAPLFAEIGLARALVFQGKVEAASASAARAVALAEVTGEIPARVLSLSTAAYIAAQFEDRVQTERLTALVLALEPTPVTYLTVGSHVLCAYALAAVGASTRAAAMILAGGGGPSLPRLQTVDRAYAYELLVTDAIERNDLTAARGWGRRSVPLQIHDMAAAAVERTLSRIDVATGRFESGAERAAVAAARNLVAGGRLDAARSRVLQATAIAATGARRAAVASFREAAEEADILGAVAVRNWSARELRRLGRRLLPAAGSGWPALSEREQQVTLLAAEGYSNRMIGQALFLSERTVQSHLSRALVALGASSRAAIPASLGRGRQQADVYDELTERQQQVASLIADGCSNRTISAQLGISDKTVEKHVQAIFARWQVSSRTGIANRVLSPLRGEKVS
jgi:DNA-binding NarL/FixJ family response regulator